VAPEDVAAPLLEHATAARPVPGERESGDSSVAFERDGRAMLAVIDGLGHGPLARAAAMSAAAVVEAHAHEPPDHILSRCHAALVGTRGAVITLAAVDLPGTTLSWCGVGDVTGILICSDGTATHYVFAPLRAGIVGLHMSLVRSAVHPFAPGDALVLASDGVRLPLDLSWRNGDTARAMADRLLADHGLENDDATVIVARYAMEPA
jgi:negative regulator of sigma-B (phosphoserine phosphatase)